MDPTPSCTATRACAIQMRSDDNETRCDDVQGYGRHIPWVWRGWRDHGVAEQMRMFCRSRHSSLSELYSTAIVAMPCADIVEAIATHTITHLATCTIVSQFHEIVGRVLSSVSSQECVSLSCAWWLVTALRASATHAHSHASALMCSAARFALATLTWCELASAYCCVIHTRMSVQCQHECSVSQSQQGLLPIPSRLDLLCGSSISRVVMRLLEGVAHKSKTRKSS